MKKMFLTAMLLSCSLLFASVSYISTEDLQKLIETNNGLVILDSRSEEFYSGVMIPGAKWVPYDTTDAKILAAVPSKDATIVVYCYSATCPASGRLIDRLSKMGYTHILDYKPGLKEWEAAGHPTT